MSIFNKEVLCETQGSAGFDIKSSESTTILPGTTKLIHTDLFFDEGIKSTEYLAVHSRSGLAVKKSVFVLNAPGVVDADYKGEICVILHNSGTESFVIEEGDRIAQGIILRHHTHEYVETKDGERGQGGFGSTGK